jgi:hypothetical protein
MSKIFVVELSDREMAMITMALASYVVGNYHMDPKLIKEFLKLSEKFANEFDKQKEK